MHKGFCFAGLASSLLLVVGCAAQGGDVSTDDEGTVGGDALTSVACLPNTTCPSYVDWGIDAAGQTRGAYPSISLSTPDFDYAPTAMYDGVYKAWWCAAGGIHYATAPSLDGPWTQSGVVLAPSRVQGSFDRDDVCDPSVVRVDGTYYMYYGANNYTDASGPYYYTTNIGVASSPDGVHWTRMNGGRPIVVAHRGGRCTNPNVDACSYGAGQPSVVFSRDSGPNRRYYMMFYESDGANGGGSYAVAAADAAFTSSLVEYVGPSEAWQPYAAPSPSTIFAQNRNPQTDWMFSDLLNSFVAAYTTGPGAPFQIHFYGHGTAGDLVDQGTFSIQAANHSWEGPGLVRRPDGHALPAFGGDGGRTGYPNPPRYSDDPSHSYYAGNVPIDLLFPVAYYDEYASCHPNQFSEVTCWEIDHLGTNLRTHVAASSVPFARALEGLQTSAWQRPLAVVRSGERLQFALAAPANRIAHAYYYSSIGIFDAMPYGASLFDHSAAYAAPARPGAFQLDDGKLWPVSCPEILTDDHTTLTQQTAAWWDAQPKGPALYCLR